MRSDGDRLLQHLAASERRVFLCAPFIKASVLSRLLAAINPKVPVEIVTRWHPNEVAVGVSDLEVYDIAKDRPGTILRLFDRLHAKLYVADELALIGSANLTAPALGWSKNPNLEILLDAPLKTPQIETCLSDLADARIATEAERDLIAAKALAIPAAELPGAEPVQPDLAEVWLPRLGAPARLFQVYAGVNIDRLAAATIDAANYDLSALDIARGLTENEFNRSLAERFLSMPATTALMTAIADDLTDAEAVDMISRIVLESPLTSEMQWSIVKDWLTYFMGDTIEVAPQSFVVRRRPVAKR